MSNVEDEIAAFASVSATNDSLELENKMMSGNYYVGLEFPDEYKVELMIESNLTKN